MHLLARAYNATHGHWHYQNIIEQECDRTMYQMYACSSRYMYAETVHLLKVDLKRNIKHVKFNNSTVTAFVKQNCLASICPFVRSFVCSFKIF